MLLEYLKYNVKESLVVSVPSSFIYHCFFFFSSRRRHTRLQGDWSSDVCSSDLRRWLHLLGRCRSDGRLRSLRPCRSGAWRSEERRVGKECRSRGWRIHQNKKN